MGTSGRWDPDRGREQPRVEWRAEQFMAFCDSIEPKLLPRKEEANAELQDAADSILANLGEAWDETSLGDKKRFFRYAMRSAGECERILVGLRPSRILTTEELRKGFRLLLDIKMDLRRLLNWAAAQE